MTPDTYNQQIQRKLASAKKSGIVYFATDVNLRCGHDGLSELARKSKHKVFVEALYPGEFMVFINKAQTAFKAFACGNAVVHVKLPQGEKLNMEAIIHFPEFFNGETIDYKSANAKAVEKQLQRIDRQKGKVYNA